MIGLSELGGDASLYPPIGGSVLTSPKIGGQAKDDPYCEFWLVIRAGLIVELNLGACRRRGCAGTRTPMVVLLGLTTDGVRGDCGREVLLTKS